MKRRCRCGVIILALLMTIFTGRLFAAVVKEVNPDGTLVLEDGRRVALAGVKFDLQGISVLRVLAQKQDLRILPEPSKAPSADPEPVYAYLRAKFVKFSSLDAAGAREEEIMLNAFLVHHGAARVDEASDFKEKEHFLKIQETARKKGEGIWSYEKP